MFEDKGTITEAELILISRYSEDIQDKLKEELLKSKEMAKSFSYDRWIEHMEQGLEISFRKSDKADMNVITVGKPNVAGMARFFLEKINGVKYKPSKEELEHDGRLEEFKQYPKGTKVKANGEVVY